MRENHDISNDDALRPGVLARCAFGGALMGLANLVPGVSGGTMLLASGIYPRFILAIADLTRLRLRGGSIAVLGVTVATAVLAIVVLAGALGFLVANHRWVMYSLFIGLTLGGVPLVWKMARPATSSVYVGAAVGLGAMIVLVLVQSLMQSGGSGGGGAQNMVLLALSGAGAASAMILPGVSGAYLLLVLGQYENILDSVSRLKDALTSADVAGVTGEFGVLVPLGVGVVVGVVAVSNLLKWVLERYEKTTYGVLLGFLLGAVVGLYPFQRGVEPEIGSVVRGVEVTRESLAEIDPKHYPTAVFTPSVLQVLGSVGLIGLGFAASSAVTHLGKDRKKHADDDQPGAGAPAG